MFGTFFLAVSSRFFCQKRKIAMMYLAAGFAALAAVVSAKVPQPDADGRYTLQAEGIKAQVCSL